MTTPDAAASAPAGRRRARRLRHLLLIAAPLGVMLALLVAGYHSYVTSRERYLTQSHFRALASLAEQTEGAIDGLSTAVDNAVREWDLRVDQQESCDGIDRFITSQVDLIKLRRRSDQPPGVSIASPPRVAAQPNLSRLRQTRDRTHREAGADDPLIETADAMLLFCRSQPAAVRAAAARLCPTGSALLANPVICAEKSLGEILRAYLANSTIDHLDTFVIDGSGTVLFESGNSGLRLAHLGDALRAGAAKDAPAAGEDLTGLPTLTEVTATTVVRPIAIDGTTYHLFTQPLRLQAGRGTTYATWAVGILVPDGGMDGEDRRLPLSVLAGVPLLLLIAALVLPFVKLATIGPREPLAPATVFGLAAAPLLGVMLLTLTALDWYTYHRLRARHDAELRAFVNALQYNFRDEIATAYAALATFRDQRLRIWNTQLADGQPRPQYESFTDVLDAAGPQYQREPTEQCLVDDRTRRLSGFDAVRHGFRIYPWFSMIAVADRNGSQLEKWTVEDTATPRVDMRDYSALRDGTDPARLFPIERSDPSKSYALNVMMSPNTGAMLTILSVPIDAVDSRLPSGVVTMVGDLWSLNDPLVPPDLGFAVVDRLGRVIFHSNKRRQLYENFFSETAGSLPLRAALFSSLSEYFDIEYHGQPHRALVQPLANSDLAVIAFRDKDLQRLANAELAFVAAVATFGVACLYLLWFTLGRWLLGPGLLAAAWPDPRATPRYHLLAAPLLLLLAWATLAVSRGDRLLADLAAVVAALSALTGTMLALAVGHVRSPWRWIVATAALALLLALGVWLSLELEHWALPVLWLAAAGSLFVVVTGWEPSWVPLAAVGDRRTTRAYVHVAVLLVLILGAIPTAAFFLDAYALQMEGMARTRQLRLAEGVARKNREMDSLFAKRRNQRLVTPEAKSQADKWAFPALWAFGEMISRDEMQAAAHAPAAATTSAPSTVESAPQAVLLGGMADDVCRDESLNGVPCTGPSGAPNPNDLTRARCDLARRGASALLLTALPIFTQESMWLRYALARRSSDCSWDAAGDGRMRFQPDAAAAPAMDVPSSRVPVEPPPSPLAKAFLLTAGALLLVGLWLALRWAVRQVCSLDIWEVPPVDNAVLPGAGDLHLRPAPTVLAQIRAAAVQTVDLDALREPAALASAVAAWPPGRVALLHFERGVDDPAWNEAKLALLEDLVFRRRWPVDVVSEVDLLAYFSRRAQATLDAGGRDAAALTGWARVLSRLDKRRYDLPAAPLPPRTGASALLYAECRWTPRLRGIRASIVADARWTALSPNALLELIADLAEAHYRTIWNQLTDEERVVLYHLASGGFLNPRSQAVGRQLMQRGLIRRGPAVLLMNESFRRFVRTVEDRATIRDWERAAGTSAWTWVRNLVLAVVVVGAIFLFLTQPESYAKWVALLTAVTTVGGGVTRLLGLFQSRPGAATD